MKVRKSTSIQFYNFIFDGPLGGENLFSKVLFTIPKAFTFFFLLFTFFHSIYQWFRKIKNYSICVYFVGDFFSVQRSGPNIKYNNLIKVLMSSLILFLDFSFGPLLCTEKIPKTRRQKVKGTFFL